MYVDQASLHWLHDKELSSINNKRLQGAFAYLRQFQFDLFYRKAEQMQDVDALSRAVAAAWGARETHCWKTWEEDDGDSEPAAPAARKKQQTGKEDDTGPGVAQVELEGVWGFETKMFDVDALQAEDDEVKLIRGNSEWRRLHKAGGGSSSFFSRQFSAALSPGCWRDKQSPARVDQ